MIRRLWTPVHLTAIAAVIAFIVAKTLELARLIAGLLA